MNNPTIDGVSRELFQDILGWADSNTTWHEIELRIRQLLDAPANELREHCKQCAEVVKTWPEWKQNCLGGAPVVERLPVCATCNGARVVDDGELTHSSGGIPYENGPIKCVKDCPDCLGTPEVAALQSTNAQLQARVAELERQNSSIWPSEETLITAGLGYPIGKEQAVKIYKACLTSRTDTPENADCEWCYGVGHDYYGDPCCGCCKPDHEKVAALIAELERPAQKPFAYTTTGFIELAKTHSHTGRLIASFEKSFFWNQPLFTAPPAPFAVVLPELESSFEKWWEEDGQYCRAGGGSYEKTFAYRAYEACLDATAALNGVRK